MSGSSASTEPSVPAIEVRALELAYDGLTVLDGVDLRIARGERLALLGSNGAGKSSLLRCLVGSVTPRSGVVLLDGVPTAELSRGSMARRMAVVPQQAVVPFSMPVAEVVALGRIPHEHPFLGPRERDRLAVTEAIERTGIGQLVGRDARRLSMGERQLVLLAMAVAQSTDLLILDEPTVHLDLHHQVQVMELLCELNEAGSTVIAVLHDLSLAAHFFPRLVLLDHGRIVADGAPGEVLSDERIRDVFRVDPALVRR
jgi:ABC-type cobalamin/Fe3+-siderophores transport system ATPase subunit